MLNINENFASPNIAFLFLGLFRRHQTPFVSSLVGDVDSGKVLLLHDGDELVVEDEDESAADASQHVGEVALEESGVSFVLSNFDPAVSGSLVHLLSLSGHHHQATTDRVERVGHGHRAGRDNLCDSELC